MTDANKTVTCAVTPNDQADETGFIEPFLYSSVGYNWNINSWVLAVTVYHFVNGVQRSYRNGFD